MRERYRPWRGVFPRFGTSEDVDREIRAHLEMRAEELEAAGWEPAEARAEARRRFGDVQATADECERITRRHDQVRRRGRRMGEIWQDVRYGVRALVKAPGFTVVALLTLALGIGANTAIFSVVNGVVLRPLPYEDPDELVYITERARSGGTMSVAWANFRDWRASSGSFRGMTAYSSSNTTVLGGAEPAWTRVSFVSDDFWTVFRVVPVAGRLFSPMDHEPGAAPVVVVSRAFALEVMGREDVVGRPLEAFGRSAEVVGVVPSSFDFPAGAQAWTPMPPQGESRTSHNYAVVGRLAEGVTVEQAGQEVDALMVRIAAAADAEEATEYLAVGTHTVTLHERLVGDVRGPLAMLLGAAGFVLLVACTNLASTLLARGTVRAQELAVRSALGAGRGRLVRQLLTESVVLSLVGGVAGLGLAAGVLRVIRALGEASVPRVQEVQVSGAVLLFTLGVAIVTGLAFGLLPALRSAEGGQAVTLRAGARGNAGKHGRTWGFLVATEVALAVILLVGSGLLLRSFASVLAEDSGFDASDVAHTQVALSGLKYPTLTDHVLFWDDLLERMRGAPGVSAAGLINTVPLAGFAANGRLTLDGDPNKVGDGYYVLASAGAFDALDIPLLQGRLFQESDGPDAPHVVVVSRSFAQTYWPGEDPIGRQVSGGGMDDYWNADPTVYGTVVGVVGDVRYRELTRRGEPVVYWHYKQRPYRARFGAALVAEASSGDAARVATALRSTVGGADPDVAVRVRLMRDVVADSVAERRFVLLVLAGFALVGLLLAAVGIYGVVSYSVARRTREMGIRLALGEAPESVRGRVLSGALRPVVGGLLLGVLGGVGLSRVMQGLLYGVGAMDPVTFTAVPALLMAAAFAASWVPARRGTRVDPVQAMRAE